MLLTRDQFREGVFERDQQLCVFCGLPRTDTHSAHHIVERRLWPDGGYYLDNGATLCHDCHIRAEKTQIPCDWLRTACNIKQTLLPPFFRADEQIDKWGNGILDNGRRTKGPLFDDESVQKILQPMLFLFTDWVKYPRTWHLPISPGMHKDDRMMTDLSILKSGRIIVTLKMDGENTTIYRDHVHARSVDSKSDPTRHWVQNFASQIGYQLDKGWRVCGENLAAKHSIGYHNLRSYFYGFSIWDQNNYCLSWDDTLEYFAVLGIEPVIVLYDGPWNDLILHGIWHSRYDGCEMEGFVVRTAAPFHYRDFATHVGKYVRAGHVQTTHDWRRNPIQPNGLLPIGNKT